MIAGGPTPPLKQSKSAESATTFTQLKTDAACSVSRRDLISRLSTSIITSVFTFRARLPGPDEIDMLARTHIGLERGRTSDAR